MISKSSCHDDKFFPHLSIRSFFYDYWIRLLAKQQQHLQCLQVRNMFRSTLLHMRRWRTHVLNFINEAHQQGRLRCTSSGRFIEHGSCKLSHVCDCSTLKVSFTCMKKHLRCIRLLAKRCERGRSCCRYELVSRGRPYFFSSTVNALSTHTSSTL